MSLLESLVNVIVGYSIAVLTQYAIFPWFGIESTFGEHLAIGAIFTGVSLVRSYLLRRVFNVYTIKR